MFELANTQEGAEKEKTPESVTEELLRNEEGEMQQMVAEAIATVGGGRTFDTQDIAKIKKFLGEGNAFVQGLEMVENETSTAEFEAQAAIGKARYGEMLSPEQEAEFAKIAEEQGLTVEAVKEAMGYQLEAVDADSNNMQEIRDAVLSFKEKHPKIFKVLKMIGVGTALMTMSEMVEASEVKTGGAGVRANNPVGDFPQMASAGHHTGDAAILHAGGNNFNKSKVQNNTGSGSVHYSGNGPAHVQQGGASNSIGTIGK